jgi:hypothetical protein
MVEKRLRYSDLKAQGIVNNRTTLANWIKDPKIKFPPGQLTGPNTRTWGEDSDIKPFLASRPTEPKPAPPPPRPGRHRGRPRKAETGAGHAQ